ncbi:SusC/RagA family TonB-linked outer membrane protein [Sphingobacterium sp. DR205]|nr:SusC/RagA family TonB-linked outer membrane protein [Sphingobacterium sp. DR205]
MEDSHGVTHIFNQGKIKIKGKVVDNKTKEPLASVSILSGGIAKGTTDRNGNFEVDVEAGGKIRFQLIGYEAQTKTFEAEQNNLQIALNPTSSALEEVVVTALGIKREERSLGYSATVVKGEDLTNALSNNWMDALSGKVAGVNLMRSNSGPVGSTKIILRGEANLMGDNQALIVVDGIVINNGSGKRVGGSSGSVYGTGSDNMPADYGSGMDDINPEDIENITVLKGAGAAALYGQRGANGAIIITTKSGKKGKGLGITFNSNTAMESVNRWPDFQYEYGQGTGGANYYSFGSSADGSSTSGTSSAYGPKFDGQYFFQYDPLTQAQGTERTLWRPYNNITEFFQTGKTFTNSLTVDGGSEKTSARFSYTDVRNSWIMPNTGYDKTAFALSANSKISDKLTINAKVNYNRRWSDNLPGAGYGNQSLMYWFIFWQPNADYNSLRNYWQLGNEGRKIQYPFSSYPENPFAISYEFINRNNRNTFTGNATVNYQFNKTWSLQVRSSLDFYVEDRAQERPYDAGSKLPEGSFRTQSMFSRETVLDFLLKYDKQLNSDFHISGTLGGSTLQNNYKREAMTADGLTYPGIYNMANNKYGIQSQQTFENFKTNSLYGLLTASYKNFLYADATARLDWNSTMATPVKPDKKLWIPYPALNTSFILSEVVKLPKAINYAKLRASIAGVGNGGQIPYMLQQLYVPANPLIPGSVKVPGLIKNPELKPLFTRSVEVGTEIRLLKDRINLDLALYQSNTFDQHLSRKLDPSTGYDSYMTNMGEVRNKGIEVSINTNQIKSKDGGFKWSSMLTYSANQNKIVDLPDSALVLQYRSVGSGQIVAKQGGSLGDLYGIGYQRAPDGQVIYDPTTGYALLTSDIKYLGNTLPKGKLSLGNTFGYKGFTMNVLFDTQWGGVGHSLTHYKLAEQGKTKNTLPGRYSGIIGNGVLANGDGTFRKNDVIATNIDEYYRSHFGQDNAEGSVYPTDFIKFREARLDYTFNKQLVSRYGLQRVTMGLYGRNLFIWSKWPAFDPEFGTLDNGDIVKGFEIAQFPSTRTIGFNLIVGF